LMDEVDVETIDRGRELIEAVQQCFAGRQS
jgi:hypothetical protein